MKVPLADSCGGNGTLDTSADGEGPEVDQNEEEAEKPGARVYDEEGFGVGEVTAEEDASEHGHPDPCPCYNA